jgi:predicted DNA-binding transcriptional regulator YafY
MTPDVIFNGYLGFMRAGRLLEMLLLLQARGQVTASELAERLEVSPRTVYRDAEALSSAGVPIFAERGRAGGIRLLPGYRTDVTGLTRDESKALFVLTTGTAQADLGLGTELRSAIMKVLKAVPAPFRPEATAASQRILVDTAGWMRGPEPAGQAAACERIVDPYGLVCKAGVWYLVADADGEGRLFRVSRVESAQVSDDVVVRRDGVELAGLWAELRRRVDERPLPLAVTVRVRRPVLDMFCRINAAHLAGEVTVDGDWAVLQLRFAAVKAARVIMGFGTDVEVLSPAEVRADFAAIAATVLAQYQ